MGLMAINTSLSNLIDTLIRCNYLLFLFGAGGRGGVQEKLNYKGPTVTKNVKSFQHPPPPPKKKKKKNNVTFFEFHLKD